MKKLFYLIPAAIMSVASCTSVSPEVPETPEENLVSFTISDAAFPVSRAEAASKTALADLTGSAVNWTAGDNAVLFDNISGCSGHLFTGTVLSDNTKLDLEGVVDEKATEYYLLYPYNANASLSGNYISTTLNATQTAVAGSFADKTAISFASGARTPGQSGTSGLTFTNCCAILSFTMPSYVDGATEVSITSKSGTQMTGTVEIAKADGAFHSVSGDASVKLSGTLQAGATYFAVIAPGEYANGFTFTVKTAGGNSYSTSSTKTVNAESGVIYHIGTLGLVVDATPTVTFAHTYSGSTLTGSTATLSIPVNSELAAMISSWSVTLKNSDGVVVRNYSSNSGTGSIANGYTYLPKGSYTLSATYTTQDGRSKTLAPVAVNHSVNPSFTVNVTGYTSYNYGVGADGYSKNVSTANGLDGSSIYGLGTSVTISADLMNDSKYSKTYTYSYDGGTGVSVSGNSVSIANKSGQSWAKHTLSASCTFDGVTQNASRDLHVTGLPWTKSSFTSDEWTLGSWNCKVNSTYLQLGGVSGSGECSATLVTPFYAPSNISVKLTTNIKIKTASLLNRNEAYVYVGGSKIITQTGPKGTAVTQTYNGLNGTGTLSTSNSNIKFEGKRTGANSIVEVSYINIIYN